jgi:hypothetical protein
MFTESHLGPWPGPFLSHSHTVSHPVSLRPDIIYQTRDTTSRCYGWWGKIFYLLCPTFKVWPTDWLSRPVGSWFSLAPRGILWDNNWNWAMTHHTFLRSQLLVSILTASHCKIVLYNTWTEEDSAYIIIVSLQRLQ